VALDVVTELVMKRRVCGWRQMIGTSGSTRAEVSVDARDNTVPLITQHATSGTQQDEMVFRCWAEANQHSADRHDV